MFVFPASYLIEVSVQEAAGQIRGSFHQFEEAHKVVIVDRCERLDGKFHLGGIAHLISELLHLAGKEEGTGRRKFKFLFFILQL